MDGRRRGRGRGGLGRKGKYWERQVGSEISKEMAAAKEGMGDLGVQGVGSKKFILQLLPPATPPPPFPKKIK